ncbi:hypothetical protein CFR75_12200 [Komagataeibacter xylinus]|uniref:Uncharacterized protein n=1 Tax=Komagataeibacter xylinus TaxID=28448 RepID=A0A318PRT6_KOMXY|nr:hypothetical protein [Komagataeibacter xylinus]PYD56183.1 hypothetical protein CFR75_12200 [Komagataeibacter xylinus]GBQ76067.1 hypothetical protein AA15237_2202 [Komagataeibacter xylinus NBRC 15237]
MEILDSAGFSGPVYRDELSRNDMRTRNVEALTQRAEMLRPIKRPVAERIAVASLRCLALTAVDLSSVLVAAAKRKATIHAVDTGEAYPPGGGIEDVQAAMLAWERGRRTGQTLAARKKAAEVNPKLVEERRERALNIALPLWGLPTAAITGPEIAKRAGISVASLITHLGPRRKAQKKRERNDLND